MEKISIDSKFADQEGEIMVVELGGYVDQSNSYLLQQMFDNIIQSGCYKVVVDFKNLYYMSSAGWGVFVGEIKRFRENGGDIKLAAMNPEIYDVYQMLEFYHILDDYPKVEEAAASFGREEEELNLVINKYGPDNSVSESQMAPDIEEVDLSQNNNALHTEEETVDSDESSDIISFVPNGMPAQSIAEEQADPIPSALQTDIKLTDLPLPEKVKKVIEQNPLLGIFGIRQVLRHEHFGFTRVGFFELWRLLRRLDLNTKEKRYRYYRSC